MSRRILFVSGSRALNRPSARPWAYGILRAAFDWWSPALLVHGGCKGCPDEWSDDIARDDKVVVRAFLKDGSIEPTGEMPWTPVGFGGDRWTSPEHLAAHPEWRWPLVRNQAMVDALVIEVEMGAEVLCVGLGAPWSKRHGTEHTVRLARASRRMRVEYRLCPEEFGPKGVS